MPFKPITFPTHVTAAGPAYKSHNTRTWTIEDRGDHECYTQYQRQYDDGSTKEFLVILYEHIHVKVAVKPKGYVQYGDIRVWIGSGLLSDRTFEDIWTLTHQATLLLPCVRIYKEQLKPDMSVQEVGAFLKVAELLDDHTTKVEAPEDDEMPEVPVMQLPHLDIHTSSLATSSSEAAPDHTDHSAGRLPPRPLTMCDLRTFSFKDEEIDCRMTWGIHSGVNFIKLALAYAQGQKEPQFTTGTQIKIKIGDYMLDGVVSNCHASQEDLLNWLKLDATLETIRGQMQKDPDPPLGSSAADQSSIQTGNPGPSMTGDVQLTIGDEMGHEGFSREQSNASFVSGGSEAGPKHDAPELSASESAVAVELKHRPFRRKPKIVFRRDDGCVWPVYGKVRQVLDYFKGVDPNGDSGAIQQPSSNSAASARGDGADRSISASGSSQQTDHLEQPPSTTGTQ